MLEYIVFQRGFFGWVGMDFHSSADFTKDKDESEEGFIADIHKKAHSWIDEQADKDDRNINLKKLVNDRKTEFLGRLTK
jgi:hypothetical protein